jgi:hypothetical protein
MAILPEPRNECNVITIFPMTVGCVVQNPSSPNATDGELSVSITGGTPPYTIVWSNGNVSPAIGNLSVGTYTAIVTDYSWPDSGPDYTATTTCVLTAPIPTTTTTSITTAPVITYDFCLTILGDLLIHFNPNGTDSGGIQKWISDDSVYQVVWNNSLNRWEVIGGTLYYSVLSSSQYPPLSGWYLVGSQGTVVANEGDCVSLESLPTFLSSINQPSCECDGTITINPSNGTPPYQFSIDNGVSFSNSGLFNGLCPGTYNLQIKDSQNNLSTNETVILNNFTAPTTYTISLLTTNNITTNNILTLTTQYTTTVNVTPALPVGTTITFDLSHANTAEVSPNQNTGSVINNSVLTKNSTVIPPTSQPVTTYVNPNGNTIDGCQMEDVYVTQKNHNWVSVSVTNGDVIVINTTTTVNKPLTRDVCAIVTSNDSFDITNAIISGCNCCELVSPIKTNDSSGASGSSGNGLP